MRVEKAMKRIVLINVIMAFSISALCGCLGFGDKRTVLQYDVTTQIEEGKSTKDDVIRLLGKPVDISLVNEDEKWKYTYLQAPQMKYASGMDDEQDLIPAFAGQLDKNTGEYAKHTLTVYFSEDGIVKKIIDVK
ncbi:MAG: outer membrane protein assembly factor BamE [Nitrospinota bacterium]